MEPTTINERADLARRDLDIITTYGCGLRILNVGAGPGLFDSMAAETGFKSVPFDFSLTSARLWRMPGVCGDALHLPFLPSSFDVIRAKDLIEHLVTPLAFVREVHRVLKPGGLLVMHAQSVWSVFYPVKSFWSDYEHVRPFTPMSVRHLVEDAGFTVQALWGYTAGRNLIERGIAAVLSRIAPYSYLLVAQKIDRIVQCPNFPPRVS
jgi:SAM-dependent methyltransferase